MPHLTLVLAYADSVFWSSAACDQYEEDLRNGAAAPVTGTGFTSLGKQNDKFVAAAIAVVAERARPFREAQHEVGDPAFTLADAAQPKLPYRLMEAVDRMKIWKCRFREGIFTFYRDAGQIDIVATVKRNPACGRYIIKQVSFPLHTFQTLADQGRSSPTIWTVCTCSSWPPISTARRSRAQ